MTQKEKATPERCGSSITADFIKAGAVPDLKARRRRDLLYLGAKVLSCILIALLFLVAVFDPDFARVLACLGVIVCCSLAAVLVDRRFRRGKYELSDLP